MAWQSVFWQHALLAMHAPLHSLLPLLHVHAPALQLAPLWHSVFWQHALLAMHAPLHSLLPLLHVHEPLLHVAPL